MNESYQRQYGGAIQFTLVMLNEVKHPDGLTKTEALGSRGMVVVTRLGFLISFGMTGKGVADL
jgi:hypothetical protein